VTASHDEKTRTTPRRRGAPRLALLLIAGSALLGCRTLKLDTLLNRPEEPPAQARAPKTEKEPGLSPPGKYSVRVSQFLFLSDFEMKRDLPLFQDLSDLREQVAKELQLPGTNTIVYVYVFEDKERYERFMQAKYPDLPRRRAFFVAQPHSVGGPEDLYVYTYWGERVREDLRHELTHALLHSVLKSVPLWLDEGLAEYFELPHDRKGVNEIHLDHLRRGSVQPNLKRLEQLSQVEQMTPAEYRESWAWVHLMLRGKGQGKASLLGYLQQLRTHPNPGPLSERLASVYAAPEEALQTHLAQIESMAQR
jgi:hypothetical protein